MKKTIISLSLIFCTLLGCATQAKTEPFKVLVVMSYEKDFPWTIEVTEGIEEALGDKATIEYFYMDTKKDFKNGPAKAEEAFAVYQSLKPDGIITIDDNAQSMFVVPFLKNKVDTPVMFGGVNAAPEKYGYPAKNVSGILERSPYARTFSLTKEIYPGFKTVSLMMKKSPSAEAVAAQVEREKNTYPVAVSTFAMPETIEQAKTMAAKLAKQSDVLNIVNLRGLTDSEGNPMTDAEVTPIIVEAFGKPMIGGDQFQTEYGALCSVSKTGQEQGKTAAEMLLLAMDGVDVSEIPITQNKEGRIWLNLDTAKQYDLTIPPAIMEAAYGVIENGETRVLGES